MFPLWVEKIYQLVLLDHVGNATISRGKAEKDRK